MDIKMKSIFDIISNITTKRPKTVLVISLMITIVLGAFSANLKMELSWVGIAPQGDPSVMEYQEIIDDYPTMSNMFVVVSTEDGKNIAKVADKATEGLKQVDKYINSVSTKIDEDFMTSNGLLLMDEGMIEGYSYYMSDINLEKYLQNINIGINIEIDKAKKVDFNNEKDKNKLLDGEDYFVASIRGLEGLFNLMSDDNKASSEDIEENISRIVLGDTYVRSRDGNKILISVQPNFDLMDFEVLVEGVNAIENKLIELEKEIPQAKFELTGMHIVGRDEMNSVESDSALTMIGGVILILALLYIAFRFKSAPLLAFVPLVLGVIWDIGLTAIIIGRLNLITAFTAIMLIGLGIDFSIHLLSGYTEGIYRGKEKLEAIRSTIYEVGPSIFTGALTTAAAFLTLTISSLELLNELGIVMGMGIVTTLLAVLFILPALLTIKKHKKVIKNKIVGEYKTIGKIAILSKRYSVIVLIVLICGSGIMGWFGSKNSFDLNMMNLEPKGLDSIKVMEDMVEDFGMSSEGFLVKTDSIEELYKLGEDLKKEEGVATVISIADFVPQDHEQEKRLKKIKAVEDMLKYQTQYIDVNRVELVSQLKQLENNINEFKGLYVNAGAVNAEYINTKSLDEAIKDLESNRISEVELQQLGIEFYETLKRLSKEMISENKIDIKDLPEDYKNQFVSENDSSFLLAVYPDFDMWQNLDKEKGKSFLNMIREKNSDFTGVPIFMNVLYESVSNEGIKSVVIVFSTLLLIIFLHFKSIKYTIMAFIPLATTLLLTIGTMQIIGMKWNVLNVLALPLIVGIGVDDAVHILHRYIASKDSLSKVFSSVGRAILLTTLTTMIGFGSLAFSSYRGMANLGIVLFIGVAYAFLTTVLILPILLKERTDEEKVKI